MQHTVFINPNNIIEIHFLGDISYDDLNNIAPKIVEYGTVLGDEGYDTKILLDYTNSTNTEELAATLAKAIAKSISFRKAAGFGANEASRKVFDEVVRTANVEDKVHIFDTRAEAEAWLSQ